jgi:hypothetical protein
MAAVEDVSDYAVRTAAKEFIKGTIEAHDKRFAPSTAQFASRCDLHERNVSRAVEYVAKHPEALTEVEAPAGYRDEIRKRIASLPGLIRYQAGDVDGEADAA